MTMVAGKKDSSGQESPKSFERWKADRGLVTGLAEPRKARGRGRGHLEISQCGPQKLPRCSANADCRCQ